MTASNRAPRFRADHVGSLLRPQRLLDARRQFEDGEIGREALQEIEDDCVRHVARVQEGAGLGSITDGEFRHAEFIKAIRGIRIAEPDRNLPFTGGDSGWEFYPSTVRTEAKLHRPGDIMKRDSRYWSDLEDAENYHPLAQPHPFPRRTPGGEPRGLSGDGRLLGRHRGDLPGGDRLARGAGCRYIQVDDPVLTYFLDSRLRESVRTIGEDPDDLLRTYVDLLNACVRDRRPDTYLTVHLCRGNARSKWISRGSYEPIAEAIFADLDFDAFFLEYDDERSGGFEPLRFMAEGKGVCSA